MMLRSAIAGILVFCMAHCTSVTDVPRPVSGMNRAVVFDIDGTLTPNVMSVWSARDGAADAVAVYADAGFHIIYLSARTQLLQHGVPSWLERQDFPLGDIHLAASRTDHDEPAAFKRRILETYQRMGWDIQAAYGDSSTDFAAYAAAGIDQNGIFALQRRGQNTCKPGPWIACFTGWEDQRDHIISRAIAR